MSSKKALLAGAILILCGGALDAQTYYDRQGAIVQGIATIPFDYAPLGPGQHNFAPTNTTPLTIPTGARSCGFARPPRTSGIPPTAGQLRRHRSVSH